MEEPLGNKNCYISKCPYPVKYAVQVGEEEVPRTYCTKHFIIARRAHNEAANRYGSRGVPTRQQVRAANRKKAKRSE